MFVRVDDAACLQNYGFQSMDFQNHLKPQDRLSQIPIFLKVLSIDLSSANKTIIDIVYSVHCGTPGRTHRRVNRKIRPSQSPWTTKVNMV